MRGKSGHVPFWPGGLDEALKPDSELDDISSLKGLRTKPPGFWRGLRFGEEGDDDDIIDIEGDGISQAPEFNSAIQEPPLGIDGTGLDVLEPSEIDELLPTSVRTGSFGFLIFFHAPCRHHIFIQSQSQPVIAIPDLKQLRRGNGLMSSMCGNQ